MKRLKNVASKPSPLGARNDRDCFSAISAQAVSHALIPYPLPKASS